jgi:hypothetical protein
MKLFTVASLSALTVTSAMVLISYERHTDYCQELQQKAISNYQSQGVAPNGQSWDEYLTANGYPKRPNVLGNQMTLKELDEAYPETCQPFNAGMTLANAILTGILIFSALSIPLLLRGLIQPRHLAHERKEPKL